MKAFQCMLYRLKTSLQWHIMRKKSRLLLYVSYVLMSERAYLCQKHDKTPHHVRSTRQRFDVSRNRPHLSVTRHVYTSKNNLLKAFQCTLYRLKTSFRWHIMSKKSRLLLYVSYVLMSEWAYLCQNTIRRTINSFTCQPVNFCKLFSKNFNTKSGLSIHQLPTLPQKIDSREGLS